jgi:hypothetical protein
MELVRWQRPELLQLSLLQPEDFSVVLHLMGWQAAIAIQHNLDPRRREEGATGVMLLDVVQGNLSDQLTILFNQDPMSGQGEGGLLCIGAVS